ncbi:hypothetical protein [Streptomyces palmae]|uniref:DUF2771 domain-containing protein n=1 Tax=Streptomyces palmae TaxID=1701085 RepID=A0A4Z0HA71_9ACTN|nr:hypothetical protein [Streptomyces palmae]TGB06266.1 hypothetical protein E4099_18475 [Streptomyces palmae]
MTAALFSRGKASRAAAAACAVTLGLVALTACDKPTPLATVTVGSTTKTAEATKGCFDEDKKLSQSKLKECLNKDTGKTIKVQPGQRVGIGVDPKIAEYGWIAATASSPLMGKPSKETYRSFDGESLFVQKNPLGQAETVPEVNLAVVQIDENGGAKGVWHFKLKLES